MYERRDARMDADRCLYRHCEIWCLGFQAFSHTPLRGDDLARDFKYLGVVKLYVLEVMLFTTSQHTITLFLC
jgi:hypothetical protein